MEEKFRGAAPHPHGSSEQDDVADDADAIRAQVAVLLRDVYRSATAIAAGIGRAAGIHPTDADALRLLDAASARPTMTELGAELGLSSASVTALVDRLEHAALARRVRDDADRRRVHVELTELAHQFAADQLTPLMQRIHGAIGSTEPADLAVVARFLAHLVEDTARRRSTTE
jgi:DNA-binding MarR family transcriptional regulator